MVVPRRDLMAGGTARGREELQNAQEVSGGKTTLMNHQQADLWCSALVTKTPEHVKSFGKNYGESGPEQVCSANI